MTVDDITKKDCLGFRCLACGTEFASSWNDGLHRRCPACFPELHGTSRQEAELVEFLKSAAGSDRVFSRCERNRLPSGKEVDAVVDTPSGVVGVEYDGLYWHSELAGKGRGYHLSKTLECEASGIRLVHVFESEWLSKREIVKSRLGSALGLYGRTVYARRCAVRQVSASESRRFQDENHIQGAAGAKVSLGLYFGDELVSLMTFGKCRFDRKHEWELVRFCSKLNTRVVGGAGKLLRRFENDYRPVSLVSYADRRWSIGRLYDALGFRLDHASQPDYWYFRPRDTSVLYSRVRFQKHKLKDVLQKFDESKSEAQNMKDNGFFRIFDCGNLVYEKTYQA